MGHDFSRLGILAEQPRRGLRQVVERFLHLAGAQGVADIPVAAAVAVGVGQVALLQAPLHLLEQGQHEFQAALLAVVQQRIQFAAGLAAQAPQGFGRMPLDAVLARLGGGAGLADGVALQLRQQFGHLLAPQFEVVGAHDAVHLQLHLLSIRSSRERPSLSIRSWSVRAYSAKAVTSTVPFLKSGKVLKGRSPSASCSRMKMSRSWSLARRAATPSVPARPKKALTISAASS